MDYDATKAREDRPASEERDRLLNTEPAKPGREEVPVETEDEEDLATAGGADLDGEDELEDSAAGLGEDLEEESEEEDEGEVEAVAIITTTTDVFEGEGDEKPLESMDAVKPVATYLTLPILIRCAEARGDQEAAEAYAVEYAVAKKDLQMTEEAKNIIEVIEEGVRSGAALATDGLLLDPIPEGMMEKIAALFGAKVEDGEIRVKSDGAVLTVTSKGAVTLAPA